MTYTIISMCDVMLSMIILVLALFKFPVILNSFTRFPSYTNFSCVTVSYHSSSSSSSSSSFCSLASSSSFSFSSLTGADSSSFSASFSAMPYNRSCCPYRIFSIILLYNKEAVSRTLCSLYAIASRVAPTGADTALYNFEIVFLKNVFIVLLIHF